jgi:hypothetical protein
MFLCFLANRATDVCYPALVHFAQKEKGHMQVFLLDPFNLGRRLRQLLLQSNGPAADRFADVDAYKST